MQKKTGHYSITLRQRKFVRYFVEIGDAGEAARRAGYSPKWARANSYKLLKNKQIAMMLDECLDKAGLTNDVIAQKLKEGADAMDTKFFAKDGEVIDEREVIAWDSRHKYLETAAKIKGYLTRYQHEIMGKDGAPLNVVLNLGDLPDPEDLDDDDDTAQ